MRIGVNVNKNNKAENQEEFSSFEELEAAASQPGAEASISTKGINKTYLMFGIIAVVIIIIVVLVMSSLRKQQNNTEDVNVDADNTMGVMAEVTDSAVQDSASTEIDSLQDTITEEVQQNESNTYNENAVYDSDGDLISENGIYDEDGNYVTESTDVIKPGIVEYTQEGGTTSPKVFSEDDFIKDLNGVDVKAVYSPKSYNYVFDYVNYEKRRAIMDDGMELYWLDITYHNKKYRCTTPFYIYKSLSDEGICKVKIELLTVEGGGKIISHMRVAEPGESEE